MIIAQSSLLCHSIILHESNIFRILIKRRCLIVELPLAGVEWHWDRGNKSSAAEVLGDGKSVRFHVSYSCGTAAVKGDMPMTDGQYFWEIKMTAPVYGTDMVSFI